MRKLLTIALLLLASLATYAHKTTYQPKDSVRIEAILAKASLIEPGEKRLLAIAREFLDVPYVAHTLDLDKQENLVVNTRELDCTTYVETVTSLYLCAEHGEKTFDEYCRQLQNLRYRQGNVSYPDRLHYFTTWIEDNERMGFVSRVQTRKVPFTAIQHLNVNYMSKHPSSYAMLSAHPEWIPMIKETEMQLTGKSYRYIPKTNISNTQLMRQTIHNGDIIVILTSKAGLDTSHIGIAVWHKDGLHMLNASQIHNKVVEEPMLLRTYMKKHPSQIGIRIARIK